MIRLALVDGGQWEDEISPAGVYYFHLPISAKDLPSHWGCCAKGLSKVIATLELLAQLVLLKGRLATVPASVPTRSRRTSFQFSDNSAVVAATGRWLSTKSPIDKALQALGWHCHAADLVPVVCHIAGVRNDWADLLSRRNDPAKAAEVTAFMRLLDPAKEWQQLKLAEWLAEPWKAGSDPCVRKRKR